MDDRYDEVGSRAASRHRFAYLDYGTALWLMSTSMDMLPIGVVYAIWADVGMIGAALGGGALFGEPINWTMIAGIGIIALGVTILASGQAEH